MIPQADRCRRDAAPAPPAMARNFSQLDQRTIAVRLPRQGDYQWLHGIGVYEADPDLGGVLRIAIADEVSPYELLFIESQWSGAIFCGASRGCDYMLSVA